MKLMYPNYIQIYSDGKTQVHAENLNSKMCMKNKINRTNRNNNVDSRPNQLHWTTVNNSMLLQTNDLEKVINSDLCHGLCFNTLNTSNPQTPRTLNNSNSSKFEIKLSSNSHISNSFERNSFRNVSTFEHKSRFFYKMWTRFTSYFKICYC